MSGYGVADMLSQAASLALGALTALIIVALLRDKPWRKWAELGVVALCLIGIILLS